jgi:hypothetical protein
MPRSLLAVCAAVCFGPSLIAAPVITNTLYNDGLWIVQGINDTAAALPRIAVSVDSAPTGAFTSLRVARLYGSDYSQIYTIESAGRLLPTVPANGIVGGAFQLTGYWDCSGGARMDLRIATLNILPNKKNASALQFRGTLTDDTALQSQNLALKLDMPDAGTVRLNARYTLTASAYICVDQWRQNTGEGWQVARMAAHYLAPGNSANDTARVFAYLDQVCDCCHCWWLTGSLCSPFINETGYIFSYQAWMAGSQLRMLNTRLDPPNTATLAIEVRKPNRKECSVQGYLTATTDPATNNARLWINWDFPQFDYPAGQKIRKFHFDLLAQLPGPEPCDEYAW